ncbi:MAG: hypothetical protein UIL36_06780, partial [Turicibacter sp.]|nr:hypothetical protein [Turicibacter sp.]
MRKPFRPFIIIGLIAAIGVFFGLTYKFPEIEVFQYYQNIDQQIITCENKSPETLETTLNTLQESIRNVISVGKTYDGKEDVTELFTSFNAAYEGLKKYTANVVTCMNNNLEGIDFDKVNSTLSKLPENLSSLGEQMSTFQKTRTEKLIQLNNELTVLTEVLTNFEEMFYNTKTSETVQYFQNINTIFTNIEQLHG